MQPYTLIKYVREHGPCPTSELTRRFGVSERTVRKYARIANDSLAPVASIRFSRPLNGYVLDVASEEGLEGWLSRQRAVAEAGDSTPESRVACLIVSLLSRSGWVTVSDLAAELYVSPPEGLHRPQARRGRPGALRPRGREAPALRGARLGGGDGPPPLPREPGVRNDGDG